MSRDYEAEVAKHQQFADETSKRINRLLAEHDPLYSERYHEKRRLIQVKLQTVSYEIIQIKEKLGRKEKEHSALVQELEDLDQAHKNWEPM
jgi:hypothetical protein